MRDYAAIDQLGAALLDRFGRIDALAACAGALGALTPAHQATPSIIEETISLNYIANQRLIRALHPLLRASAAGRAVFITTGVAREPRAYFMPYAASKAAMESLVLCWAAELNVTPIKANLFSPGAVRTAMRAKAFPGEDPETLPPPEEVAPQITAMLTADYAANGEIVRFQRA
jgi:NAD(P)-dependent dehydrogenase (short-subunit alcohol dehydrogenase family)